MIYDLAVIGCGGIGSAVLYHATAQGAKTIGIEQFELVHNRGSSHGHTRIIRQAYFEHPNYVPLLIEAYELWAELEQMAGEQLYVQTGLLQAGPADGIVVPGVLRSAAEHNLPIDRLTSTEAVERYSMFRIPHDHIAAFEHRAGYLFVERCVAAHLQVAQRCGAKLHANCRVMSYQPEGTGYRIQTSHGEILAKRIVVTVGAWLSSHSRVMPLQILRKHLHWFTSTDQRVFQSKGCPLFFFENEVGCFYGFPAIDDKWGLKVAEHSGGEPITDPASLDRSIDPVDQARINSFVQSYFHGEHRAQSHDVCMYTMTPDHHFLVDEHPELAGVFIAGGFSGHGFKFASVLGKQLARAAINGVMDSRLRFLSTDRSVHC